MRRPATGKVIALNGSGPRAGRRHDRLVRAARHLRRWRTPRPTPSPCPARSTRGRRCWRRTAARAWTSCCSRRSAMPPKAGRCIRKWRGTGSGWRPSCARTARTRSCPNGAAPEGRRHLPPTRRWPRHCAAIARHGAKAFYEGRSPPTWCATLRARGGLHTEAGFRRRPAQRRIRRADHAELEGLRRLPVPAERPGHRRR